MDYIDFIDSPTIREHLRTLPPLPPAQQCILIAQSAIRPLMEKFAALREIRAATPPGDFACGCWHFQSDDPFPVILDRYLKTRKKRIAEFYKGMPGFVYVVESTYRSRGYGTPFSTFDAALASVEPLEDDERPPRIRRRRIDDSGCANLVAHLSRDLKVCEIDTAGGLGGRSMRVWGGDLPNGYAYVPHPFKRGDIVRQGDSYYVLDESVEESEGRFSWGTDESDMVLYGMSWDSSATSFGHEHIDYTRYGTELVAPADLPEKEKMLAAVATVMRDSHLLIEFLQCFTNGYQDDLEKWIPPSADAPKETGRPAILRSDVPGLPANIFVCRSSRGWVKAIRVQRDGKPEPHYRDTVELTLDAEPQFIGGTGDLTPGDVQKLRDFVVRNLDPLLAYREEKLSFDDLIVMLRKMAGAEIVHK